MKKFVLLMIFVLAFANGCKKSDSQLLDRIAQLEKRIEVLEKRPAAAPDKPAEPAEQTTAYDLPVGNSYVWGPKTAPITITKFSDYQCPFCNRAHETFVEKVMEDPELGGKGLVKVVFKHFPLSFHKNAKPASKAALAAGEQGDDCFWQMTKKLYTGQGDLSEENFKKWAGETKCKKKDGKEANLDVTRFLSDLKSNDAKYEGMIKDDMELGMNKANVRGTPSFFVNGWKLSARSVDAVKQMIANKSLLKAAN